MTKKRLSSLRVVGRTIFLMASTFSGIGCILDRMIQYLRYSISLAQNVDFTAFTRKTLSDNIFRTYSDFLKVILKVDTRDNRKVVELCSYKIKVLH
jgi:hypothetical protein